MLAGKSRDEVEALYRSRVPFYRRADLTVDTTALTPDQVARQIARALRERERPLPSGERAR
jgi:shikimate kinase